MNKQIKPSNKLNIDDLLSNFKTIKDPKKKLSVFDQLNDESWVSDVFDSNKELNIKIPSTLENI